MSDRIPKNYIDPVSGVPLGQIMDDSEGFAQVIFDPNRLNGDVKIYEGILNQFDKDYKEVMKMDIQRTDKPVRKTYNLDTDDRFNNNYNHIKKVTGQVAREKNFGVNTPKNQMERFTSEWASEIGGLMNYLEGYLPDKKTIEGKELHKRYNALLDDVFENFYVPAIEKQAEILETKHSIDSKGDWWNKTIGSATQTLGTGLQVKSSDIAKVATGAMNMLDPTSPVRMGSGKWSRYAEDLAQEIYDAGDSIAGWGGRKMEGAKEPTGVYAESFVDRIGKDGVKTFLDASYVGYKVGENLGSQMFTTAPTLALQTAAQLNPYVRGMGLFARTGMGLLASTPALAVGNVMETGDAYQSARSHLLNLRRRAKGELSSIGSKDADAMQEFNDMYSVYLNEAVTKTVDKLDDDDIHMISKEIADAYGYLSTGIEALGNLPQAGILARGVANNLGIELGKKETKKELTKYVTDSLYKRIMKNKVSNVAASGVSAYVQEGLTEGLQQFTQENILSRRLPMKDVEIDQVWNAAIAGGFSGASISTGVQSTFAIGAKIGEYRDNRAYEQLDEEYQFIKQEARDKTSYDDTIRLYGAMGVGYKDIGEFISSRYNEDEQKSIRLKVKERYLNMRSDIENLRKNPQGLISLIKNNKEEIGSVVDLNEPFLQALGLQPSQIADVLGVKISDLNQQKGFNYENVQKERQQSLDQSSTDFTQPPQRVDGSQADDPTAGEVDPTVGGPDPTIMGDPTVDFDPTLYEEKQVERLKSEIESLKRGSQNTHLSPEERTAQIEALENEIDKLQIGIIPTKAITKSPSEMTVAELKSLAKEQGKTGYSRLSKKELTELVSDETQDEPEVKQSTSQNAINTAANFAAMMGSEGMGAFNISDSYDALELQDLEELNPGFVKQHAEKKGLITENKSTSELIEEIVEKFPKQMNMGMPLTISQKAKWNREFNKAWITALDNVENVERMEGFFRMWVETKVGPLLPEPLQKHFLEWASNKNPAQIAMGETYYKVADTFMGLISSDDKFSKFAESEIREVENAFVRGEEYLMEAIYQADIENADIQVENFTHLNSRFFEAMNVTLDNDMIASIEKAAVDNDTFQGFVTEISKKDYSLLSPDGETPSDIVNKNSPLKRKLRQYYVSNRAENNVMINMGERENGQTPKQKAVYLNMNNGSKGFTYFIKDASKGRKRLPTNARATMADRFVDTPIVWLNGSDLTKYNHISKKFESVYGFLSKDLMDGMIRDVLSQDGVHYVPLFVRGDSDRMAMIQITDAVRNMNPEEYWAKELKDNKKYEDIKEVYMKPSKAFGDEMLTKLANIQRHIAYKEILGEDYHTLSAHKVMQRIKILYTPALTFTGGKPSLVKILNTKKALEGKQNFITETTYEDGTVTTKNLVKLMNDVLQYTGDGLTLTSEKVFREKYPNEIGANPEAFRAKTVKAYRGELGTALMKHQEMTFDLPENAVKSDVILGGKKVAEVRRDKGQVNIFVADDDGGFTKYVDHLNTDDESKVLLGDLSNYDKIHKLPSEATGHIMLTEGEKVRAPFPMQLTNYMDNKDFLNALNDLMEDSNNSQSTISKLRRMMQLAQNPDRLNEFLLETKSKYPDSVPRMIMEMAALGAGHHESVFDIARTIVKNRLFSEAMDNKQDGGVLDFRASYTRDVEKGKIILPYDSQNMRDTVSRQLAEQTDGDMLKISNLPIEEINKLLKKNPVKINLVRHPIPSRAGYRVLQVESLETGIGDSFIINDEDVKEVFEGDFDHDTGHIFTLPFAMQRQMDKQQDFDSKPTNLSQYEGMVKEANLGSLDETLELMVEMSAGQTAIGEIANMQRAIGIGQQVFGSMEINGKTVKMRSLDAEITDPKVGTMLLEDLMKHYAQAAFDNVNLRLLKAWDYSQDNMIKKIFYNSDNTPIDNIQVQVLKATFLNTIRTTQAIKNNQEFGNKLDLDKMLARSIDYKNFTENRETYLRNKGKDKNIELEDGQKVPASNYIGKINMKDGLHPHEKLIIMVTERADAVHRLDYKNKKLLYDDNGDPITGINVDDLFVYGRAKIKMAHDLATKEVTTDTERLSMVEDAYGDIMDNLNQDQLRTVLKDIETGEQWGATMRQNLMEVYAKMEESKSDEAPAKIANSLTWDYNKDFVDFTQKWLNGFTYDNGTEQAGYNQLTPVAQVSATYQFLEGIIDARDGQGKNTVRKLPPISRNPGETLLNPDIMSKYFDKYNDVITDVFEDGKEYGMRQPNKTFNRLFKEFYNCE